MLTKRKINNTDTYIFCKELNTFLLYAEDVKGFSITNITIGLLEYSIRNGHNVLAFDLNSVNMLFKLNTDNLVTPENLQKLFTFIQDNDYVGKIIAHYKIAKVSNPFQVPDSKFRVVITSFK